MKKDQTKRLPRIDTKAFKEFVKEISEETDRAAVILGAAKLDLILYQLLIKVLLSNAGSRDDLFDGDGPLSTFSAKIHISYRLGLIDSDSARSLHLIRKIRNDFAHELTGSSLESGPHRDRVKELIAPFAAHDNFTNLLKMAYPGKDTAGKRFRFAVAIIGVILEDGIHDAEPMDSSKSIKFTALFLSPRESENSHEKG